MRSAPVTSIEDGYLHSGLVGMEAGRLLFLPGVSCVGGDPDFAVGTG